MAAFSYIVMGVSGCGKSTIGTALANKLNLPYIEGDSYHPQENIDKMAAGIPLDDNDRIPWLKMLSAYVEDEHKPCILSCSALKESYRELLRNKHVKFIFLKGEYDVLLKRIKIRSANTDHFMPASLLDSQLNTLQSPEFEDDVITVNIDQTEEEILKELLYTINC